MSVDYSPILWNRQKRIYDKVLLSIMVTYLLVFSGAQVLLNSDITIEILIIRATGTLAFLMLNIILMIGPLARIDRRFLPLLYNRRHFGVLMFLMALLHAIVNLVQFHGFSDTNPLVALLTSNTNYGSVPLFPFQVLGFLALVILALMAATSHDFWLKNLSPRVWKALHMMVYLAYVLIIAHVLLGVIQLEKSPVLVSILAAGALLVSGVHIWAGRLKTMDNMLTKNPEVPTPFELVCSVDDIGVDRAKTILIDGENIAVFKYEDQISAVSNLCRHQNGPLGEGKIVDGCITCPWHGYQYLPHNGQSPPPFDERLETYDVMIWKNNVYVNPMPYAPGTERTPAPVTVSDNDEPPYFKVENK